VHIVSNLDNKAFSFKISPHRLRSSCSQPEHFQKSVRTAPKITSLKKIGFYFQARPKDYALPGTPSRPPISFHKHFMIDPVEVYEEHFEVVDKEVAALDAVLKSKANLIPTDSKRHTEL